MNKKPLRDAKPTVETKETLIKVEAEMVEKRCCEEGKHKGVGDVHFSLRCDVCQFLTMRLLGDVKKN